MAVQPIGSFRPTHTSGTNQFIGFERELMIDNSELIRRKLKTKNYELIIEN